MSRVTEIRQQGRGTARVQEAWFRGEERRGEGDRKQGAGSREQERLVKSPSSPRKRGSLFARPNKGTRVRGDDDKVDPRLRGDDSGLDPRWRGNDRVQVAPCFLSFSAVPEPSPLPPEPSHSPLLHHRPGIPRRRRTPYTQDENDDSKDHAVPHPGGVSAGVAVHPWGDDHPDTQEGVDPAQAYRGAR